MKKTAAVILLFAFVLSASVTSFAQRSRAVRPPVTDSGFVQFQYIRSYTDGQGVYIGWQMEFETRNVGFNVYRMTESGPQMVNRNIIGGFAARTSVPTGYGERYEFYDPDGVVGSVYFIQSLATDGRRVSTAAFATKFTENFERDTGHPKVYFEELAQNHNGDIERRDLKLTKELKTIVNSAMLAPDPNTQRWVAAQPGAKIAVKQEGMYRVTRAELQNAGFNVNANSANWRLFQEGNEQAIIVGPGDQYIDFYGRSLDALESDTRMYYLIADTTAGKRIDTRVLRNLGGPVTSNSYAAGAVRKERTLYISTVLNGDAENYWGTVISDTPRVVPDPDLQGYVPFILSDIDTASPNASVTIRLQGLLRGNHHVHATFNGHELGFLDFTDQQSASATFYIPTSFLIEGPNFFEFTAAPGGDFSLFDTATINYSRRYVAENDRLAFFTPGYRKADVRNFTSSNVRVFDTTYDGNTQLLINFPIVQNGGTFMARLPSDRPAVMYAVADSGMLQSTSVTFNNPSTLSSTTNAADVVIISHSAPDFMAAAETWANYRRSAAGGSFSVRVVDVADVYDEFNYGVLSANSITGFLDYAKNYWQAPGPRYVLLLGDGSYDPRNYEGRGNWDLIPVKMVDLIFGESASDDALADFDHDGTANIPIGRIPARAMADITTSLNKTITFETPAGHNLDRGALCAYDRPQGYDFYAMCQALMNELPPGMPITYVGRDDPQAHTDLISGLSAGPYIANYSGHGSAGLWASSSFFGINDVPLLSNAGHESIYTMLTCFNGLFTRPTDDSLAEALLKAQNGGAVASWASTTETTPDLQLLMAVRFYDQVSLGAIPRIGDLIFDAKTHSLPPNSDVGYSWTLLGDPGLKVR